MKFVMIGKCPLPRCYDSNSLILCFFISSLWINNNTYTDICIFSYNSRGFGEDKQEIFKLLMLNDGRKVPIIYAQEHFLLRNFKVKQALPNCHIFFKEAVMTNVQGRPKNGMFVAIPMEFQEHVEDVSPKHWRAQTVVITTKIMVRLQ